MGGVGPPERWDSAEQPRSDRGRRPLPRVGRARGCLVEQGRDLPEVGNDGGERGDAGRFPRRPEDRRAARPNPVFEKDGSRLEPRLDRGERRLRHCQAILERPRPRSFQHFEKRCGVQPLQEDVEQRIVDVAFVREEIRLERGELELRPDGFDPGDRIAKMRGGHLVAVGGARQPAQSVQRLPLLLRSAELPSRCERRFEIARGPTRVALPVETFAAIEMGLHCLPTVAALFRERERVGKGRDRDGEVAHVEGLDDADIREHADPRLLVLIASQQPLGDPVRLECFDRVVEAPVEIPEVG